MPKRAVTNAVRRALLGLLLLLPGLAAAATPTTAEALARLRALPAASLLVTDEAGHTVLALRPDVPRIPASTLKLLTALLALEAWEPEHRFATELYLTGDGWLWVRGLGDPFLVSEEIDALARRLAGRGLPALRGIGLDDGFFAAGLTVEGQGGSDNPYDAPPGALAANFNTLHLRRDGSGLHSAEPQTPLVPLARRLGAGLAPGTHRVRIADARQGARYLGELLADRLRAAGLTVGEPVWRGPLPAGARLVLRHRNVRPLRAVLAGMLRYSNNFIANQLFLLLGVAREGPPATFAKGRRAVAAALARRFHWPDAVVREGAGLSRRNRLSARELVELLDAFAPHRALLPETAPGVRAKTGTLQGVSNLAGYVRRPDGQWWRFALLINQPAPPGLRHAVAAALRDYSPPSRVRRTASTAAQKRATPSTKEGEGRSRPPGAK